MSLPSTLIAIFAAAAVVAVLVVLFIGLLSMFRGGEFNDRNANRLMRMRVIFQGIAVLSIGALFLLNYAGSP